MSNVYIVRAGWDYEGSDILKVFASVQDARDFVDNFPVREDGRPEGYDYIHVSKFEVVQESWREPASVVEED